MQVTKETRSQDIIACLREHYDQEIDFKVAQRVKAGLLKKSPEEVAAAKRTHLSRRQLLESQQLQQQQQHPQFALQHQHQHHQLHLQSPNPPLDLPPLGLPQQHIGLPHQLPLPTMPNSPALPMSIGLSGRVAQIVRLKPEAVEGYKECHARVWPEVLQQIKDSNIEDYSIFYDGDRTLFATFRYAGFDWEGDMKRMAENPKVKAWWSMTDAMQVGGGGLEDSRTQC